MPATTIYELLAELRASALDEQDKGTKFERLIQAYLTTDPEWSAKFDSVVPWIQWDRSDGQDRGIDLVAKLRESDGYAAIQCKFYAPGRKVDKAAIDSFLASTMLDKFEFAKGQLYVFDTAAGWTENVEKELVGVAQRIPISYLEDAAIDWSQFSWLTPEVVVSTEPKQLRPHQATALDDVRTGLDRHDRGKLIMACGTGKTFTSLRIAEELVGAGGSVLFLVPSIQLMSQSLREWMANAETGIRPFAVCSDVKVGRRNSDDADQTTIDLTEPATTSAAKLVERMNVGKRAKSRMTVVFATYQSIDVVADAQNLGIDDFDLIICDEAHRTTGVTLAGHDESTFVKVHDNDFIKAKKRLYMTATPRVFGDDVRKKAKDAEAVLADMGNEDLYGPELHRLGFGDAVEANLLTDYKVLVLAVDEQYVATNFQRALSESGEINLDDIAKLLGCWNGLAKNFGDGQQHPPLMKTAVAFAQNIKASKAAATAFPTVVDHALLELPEDREPLRVEAQHVDGTMGIQERNTHLTWLKEQTPAGVCRILTNARCLSEGVDVPSLDAVLFLTPRGSQVDVVQSVGRVMRKASGKELGYIILPIVVPSGIAPEDALANNERYKVVWQVLQALRSHDERFHALVNQIELNKKKPTDKVDIIAVTTPTDTDDDHHGGGEGPQPAAEQLTITFPTDEFRDAMYAKIVKKVGERTYWEDWASDVADIAHAHVTRIKGLLADPDSSASVEFERFLDGLRGNLNDNITRAEAIDMLAQHLITRPIFEALFEGYDFAANNPVAQTMERMLTALDEHNLDTENETLEKFYDSVRRRVAGVDNAEGKQRILVELYDKFFATAFKKTVDKLGIVYTPIEIVDFILKSADDVLRAEFGQGLSDDAVHVLDGFTGTGTFIVRLLQSGLIQPHDLVRKYTNELHANEILLLAYYIAAVNIETTFADLTAKSEAFPGLILTDTFQSWEPDDRPDLDVFPENNARLEELKKLDITVVVGNPPYSSGQDSANDDNANESYPALDEEIRRTYAEQSTATNKNSLYDSYIRAIKWAALRIKGRGVVAYITNGGWIDSNTADGMRKSLAAEFSDIYVFNLRGNGRVGGEAGRREGRPLFEFGGWRYDGTEIKNSEGGSRATIAIVVLVKNPDKAGPAVIHYAQVDDYLSAGQKVRAVESARSVLELDAEVLTPNEYGDWINQRRADFESLLALGSGGVRIFTLSSNGPTTARDAWVYSSSTASLRANLVRTIEAYAESLTSDASQDAARISWSRGLRTRSRRKEQIELRDSAIRTAAYRPFFKQKLYFDFQLNEIQSKMRALYPTQSAANVCIYQVGSGSAVPFSVLVVADIPDLHLTGAGSAGQVFARYRYEEDAGDDGALFSSTASADGSDPAIGGYRRIDNITDDALHRFQAAYPGEAVTKDDIFSYVYGMLHSPTYRQTYAADLKKVLPRIPLATDFRAFADGGRRLSELHLNYESAAPYPLDGLDIDPAGDPYEFFAVGAKKMRLSKDRSSIVYNDRITLSGIPAEAFRYMVGSRSAIEWIIDRYYVKTDKPSKIINNPNDWSREVGDPRYIIDLLARIITVSIETMKVVDGLPALDIVDDPH